MELIFLVIKMLSTLSTTGPFIEDPPYQAISVYENDKFTMHNSFTISISSTNFKEENGQITDFWIVLYEEEKDVNQISYGTISELSEIQVNGRLVYCDSVIPVTFTFGNLKKFLIYTTLFVFLAVFIFSVIALLIYKTWFAPVVTRGAVLEKSQAMSSLIEGEESEEEEEEGSLRRPVLLSDLHVTVNKLMDN
ncbi:hypothetical protein SK128_015113, partial [Halocaridina rubra]